MNECKRNVSRKATNKNLLCFQKDTLQDRSAIVKVKCSNHRTLPSKTLETNKGGDNISQGSLQLQVFGRNLLKKCNSSSYTSAPTSLKERLPLIGPKRSILLNSFPRKKGISEILFEKAIMPRTLLCTCKERFHEQLVTHY